LKCCQLIQQRLLAAECRVVEAIAPWNFTNCAAEFGKICCGKTGALTMTSTFKELLLNRDSWKLVPNLSKLGKLSEISENATTIYVFAARKFIVEQK